MFKIILVATVVAMFLTICEVRADAAKLDHCGTGQYDDARTRNNAGGIVKISPLNQT